VQEAIMSEKFSLEPMVDMYLFETGQLIDKLEQIIMRSESQSDLSGDIDEIFRIMHTIKGNSMMMMYDEIANLAHSIEDFFDFLKAAPTAVTDLTILFDVLLETVDFFKLEIIKISSGDVADGTSDELVARIKSYLRELKTNEAFPEAESVKSTSPSRYYIAAAHTNDLSVDVQDALEALLPSKFYVTSIHFEDGCELENVRAFSIVHGLKDLVEEEFHFPPDIIENEASVHVIRANGFKVYYKTSEKEDTLQAHFNSTAFITRIETQEISEETYTNSADANWHEKAEVKAIEQETSKRLVTKDKGPKNAVVSQETQAAKNFITVGLTKINQLMDLVGELVVSESMVTRNPELEKLQIDSFEKASRQHRFIIKEIQDVVMSMRMVPLDLTFQKMNRLLRDMTKKTNKMVTLKIQGAHTEVDKNVIEHISDPLMHIIRNAIDHGIESPEERKHTNKPLEGTILLEAKQSGGSVYIIVKDDGKGIDRERVLDKAELVDLLYKPREEYTDKEVFNLLFQPGFSTKEEVTEFSGRGVGMDVVMRNIEEVGGVVTVDSQFGIGSEFVIKIPLTLAIIEGMLVRVGSVIFSLPITSIQESMRIKPEQLISDNTKKEMVIIREECVPVIRLNKQYNIANGVEAIDEGVLVIIENDQGKLMLFVDEMIGEQQLVVKRIPKYIQKVDGISGCALLGDGKISLIIDPTGLS